MKEDEEKQKKINEYLEKGVKALEEEQFTKARDNFDKALDLDPDVAYAYAMKGESFYREDNEDQISVKKAVDNANKAIDKDKNLWIPHNTLGHVYADLKNWNNAIKYYSEASRLNPEDANLLYELGKAQYRAKRFKDARQSFEGSIHIFYGNERAHFNLGLTLLQLNEKSRANSSFKETIKINPDFSTAYYMVAENYHDQGDYKNAETYYKKAVVRDPENINFNIQYGVTLNALERYDEAKSYFNAALSYEPNNDVAYYYLAIVNIKMKNGNEALSSIAKALKIDTTAPYLYTLGEAAELIGDTNSAITAYNNAIKIKSDYELPKINLGKIYDEQGDYDKALDQLLSAYKNNSKSYEVNYNLGNVYLHKQLYKESINHYKKAIASQPNETTPRYHLALAYIETEQRAVAKTTLSDLLKIDSKYWEAYHRLGEVLIAEGNLEDAKVIFRSLIQKNPNYNKRSEIEQYLK